MDHTGLSAIREELLMLRVPILCGHWPLSEVYLVCSTFREFILLMSSADLLSLCWLTFLLFSVSILVAMIRYQLERTRIHLKSSFFCSGECQSTFRISISPLFSGWKSKPSKKCAWNKKKIYIKQSATLVFLVSYLLLFYPEDGGDVYLRNVCWCSWTTWLYIPEDRHLYSCLLWEPQIEHIPNVPCHVQSACHWAWASLIQSKTSQTVP